MVWTLLYNCDSDMKFRHREKQIGVRLHADQHAALREIAEREGYDSVSEFVRDLLEKAIKDHHKKENSNRQRRPFGPKTHEMSSR